MQIAFYKGEGGTFNKLIRWWTGHEYTHVELIIDGVWYSSSHTDSGVRATTEISGKSGNWDIFEVTGNKRYALEVFEKARDAKYDWLGIFFSQVLPFKLHNKQKWFCSELNGKMLGIKNPHVFNPGELFEELKASNRIGAKVV